MLAIRVLQGNGTVGLSELLAVGVALRSALRDIVSDRAPVRRPTDELRDATELALRIGDGSTVLTFAPQTTAAVSLAPAATEQLLSTCRRLETGDRVVAFDRHLDQFLRSLMALGPLELGPAVGQLARFDPRAARDALRATTSTVDLESRHLRGLLRRGDVRSGSYGLDDDWGETWSLTLRGQELAAVARDLYGRRVDVTGVLSSGRDRHLHVRQLGAVPHGSGWDVETTTAWAGRGPVSAQAYDRDDPEGARDEELMRFLHVIDEL